jgi:hypothetical protein
VARVSDRFRSDLASITLPRFSRTRTLAFWWHSRRSKMVFRRFLSLLVGCFWVRRCLHGQRGESRNWDAIGSLCIRMSISVGRMGPFCARAEPKEHKSRLLMQLQSVSHYGCSYESDTLASQKMPNLMGFALIQCYILLCTTSKTDSPMRHNEFYFIFSSVNSKDFFLFRVRRRRFLTSIAVPGIDKFRVLCFI